MLDLIALVVKSFNYKKRRKHYLQRKNADHETYILEKRQKRVLERQNKRNREIQNKFQGESEKKMIQRFVCDEGSFVLNLLVDIDKQDSFDIN